MRRTAVLAVVAFVGALVLPVVGSVAPAGAAGTTTYDVVNAYSYAAGHPFTLTVCLYGTPVTTVDTTVSDGPFTHATGGAHLTVMNGSTTDCVTDPSLDTTVTFPSGHATLMIYWPPGGGVTAVVLADDTSCTAAGFGRLTFRNGAGFSTGGAHVDVWGIPPGGVDTKIFTDVAPGTQQSTDLAVGTYTHVRAVLTGTNTTVFDGGNADIVEAQTANLYLYGGNDGSPGGFAETAALTVCAVATTTTTEPPTTTTVAAQPVVVAPAFTG
jgi:hypothetical protein